MARTPRDNNVVRHPSSPDSSFADNVRTHDAKPSGRQAAQRPPKPLTSAQAAAQANREKQMAVNAMRADQMHVANSYAAHAEEVRAQEAAERGEGYRPDEPQPYRGPRPTPQPFVSSRPLPPVEAPAEAAVETTPAETDEPAKA